MQSFAIRPFTTEFRASPNQDNFCPFCPQTVCCWLEYRLRIFNVGKSALVEPQGKCAAAEAPLRWPKIAFRRDKIVWSHTKAWNLEIALRFQESAKLMVEMRYLSSSSVRSKHYTCRFRARSRIPEDFDRRRETSRCQEFLGRPGLGRWEGSLESGRDSLMSSWTPFRRHPA